VGSPLGSPLGEAGLGGWTALNLVMI
jgi:hypothetical protein